jgi:hypothetical protein
MEFAAVVQPKRILDGINDSVSRAALGWQPHVSNHANLRVTLEISFRGFQLVFEEPASEFGLP